VSTLSLRLGCKLQGRGDPHITRVLIPLRFNHGIQKAGDKAEASPRAADAPDGAKASVQPVGTHCAPHIQTQCPSAKTAQKTAPNQSPHDMDHSFPHTAEQALVWGLKVTYHAEAVPGLDQPTAPSAAVRLATPPPVQVCLPGVVRGHFQGLGV
jgi:hypothetical protein